MRWSNVTCGATAGFRAIGESKKKGSVEETAERVPRATVANGPDVNMGSLKLARESLMRFGSALPERLFKSSKC
jgi:hypothetical protein